MQLNRLIDFHKALADPTRLRILILLSHSPLHGQAIAGKLGLKPPTITHHMTKLREAGLVTERRERNTIYFHLKRQELEQKSLSLHSLLKEEDANMKHTNVNQNYNDSILRNFLTPEGRLRSIPAQRKKRIAILQHVATAFTHGQKYPEKEINQMIQRFHDDFATLRRELIMHQFMYRDKGVYELNPVEMWPTPEETGS
ncbi:hypothetical protein SAMN05444487_11145 [Marininema mesophilum]|uniref:HTH arsR-type domain-containing protein n=1 Tax=Marininema mesophilum TaxID=1048340 RepID=A0A1H2ZFT8_9BACL|nr:metalloregulator ArsR/SmtB family transcription factor [Marininema mesophilum]SDX16177.1 hypothetical protein SAMN05444487_11145 [Marininema mesophilum]